jgi:hypothetical protein
MAAQIAAWQNFFITVGGAAAALTGLIFVGLSLHAKAIIAEPLAHRRALASIQWLMALVLLAVAVLVPSQPPQAFGIEVELVAIFFIIRSIGRARLQRSVKPQVRPRPREIVVMEWTTLVGCLVALSVSGVALMIGILAGFYLLAIAMICVLAMNVWNAWVLIAEMAQ